jgi:transcriptional regulator with XRE-family HTH domain
VDDKDQFLIDEVSKRRRELGLSLRELSVQTGISFSSIARMERGEGGPGNLARLRLLAWMRDEDPLEIQRAPRLLDAWLKKEIETLVDRRIAHFFEQVEHRVSKQKLRRGMEQKLKERN